jgi:hypothetical protein
VTLDPLTAERVATDRPTLIDLLSRASQTIRQLRRVPVVGLRRTPTSPPRPESTGFISGDDDGDFLVLPRRRAAAETADRSETLANAVQESDQIKSILREHGISGDVLELMEAWIKLQAAVQVEQQRPVATPVASPVRPEGGVAGDPFEALSAADLSLRLGGLVAETVRLRERRHALFSTLPPGRERGREYPAFQAWPGVAGAPLRQVLRALNQPDGAAAYGFFSSTAPELEGLTPVEALCGQLVEHRPLGVGAQALLAADADMRLDAICGAARVYAADLAA